MAQKSLKTLAARNAATLNRTHLISLGVHGIYLLLSLILGFRRRLVLYLLFATPALAIEIWFEQIARPRYTGHELRAAGEDLEARGLTEWMWDIVYWTWGCVTLVTFLGDRVWWLYAVVPAYSIWLGISTYTGMGKSMGGLLGNANGETPAAGGQSKRQTKLEKRGGQRVQYR